MVARFNDRGITFLVAGGQASLACYLLRDGRGWTENLRLTPDGQAEMPALPRTRSATGSIKASNELGIAGSFLAPGWRILVRQFSTRLNRYSLRSCCPQFHSVSLNESRQIA